MAKPQPDTTSAAKSREPRTGTVVGWTPERIRQAEILCASGNYSLAADLCEAMRPDPRVSKCLSRLYSATALPLTFQLPGKDAEASKNDPICQALDADFWKMFPEQVMTDIIAWLSLLRICLMHIDSWDKDPETGRVLPKISVWSPRHLRDDPERGPVVRAASSTGEYWGTDVEIAPGDGVWILLQLGTGYRAPLASPCFGIAPWWLLGKRYAPVDWVTSSERHGNGQTFISNTMSAGSGGLDSDVGEELKQNQKDKLALEVSNSGRNGVFVFPRGWKGELVTDGAKTYETFEKQKDAANSEIDMALIGTNLGADGSNGSRAREQVWETVDATKFRGLLEFLSTGIREQVLVHWHRFNFASGVAPYPHWDTTPPKDKKSESEARKADADALNAYTTAGAQIDQIAWFEGKVQLIPGATQEIKRPVAAPATPIAPDGSKPPAVPPTPPSKSKALALGDGSILAKAAAPTAFERGREYTDRLEGECVAHASKQLAPTVASIVSAISEATDYEDAKARIVAAYGDALPVSTLVKLTESALIMAQLAGIESVNQEFEQGE